MSGYVLPNGDPIELGARVRISACLARQADYSQLDQFHRTLSRKVWGRMSMHGVANEGVVVGVRTLSNGRRDYIGYDEGYEYVPEEWFRAVLVSTDLRSRPVFARFEDVEVLP